MMDSIFLSSALLFDLNRLNTKERSSEDFSSMEGGMLVVTAGVLRFNENAKDDGTMRVDENIVNGNIRSRLYNFSDEEVILMI